MAGTRSSNIHLRVNPDVIARAAPILEAIGLSFSDAFNLMLNQIFLKRRIPFELSSTRTTENDYTPEFELGILSDADNTYTALVNQTARLHGSTAKMFSEWDKEDESYADGEV